MTAAKSFHTLKICLAKKLAVIGFTARNSVLARKVNDTLVMFEFQKDLKRSTKEEIFFTVNLGISIDVLRNEDGSSKLGPLFKSEKPQWHTRLGRLLPINDDTWWSVRDEQAAMAICESIANDFIRIAFPKIQTEASSEALVQAWREGRGRGLTEYERRANLAKLLCALGRDEEASVATRELEAAAIGSSWEIAAQYEVRHLDQLLNRRISKP